jgi:hypothetical protein
MPAGKAAGIRCIQLDPENRCRLFGDDRRPGVCGQLLPSAEMCGTDVAHAMRFLGWLEQATAANGGVR